ncbi:MAG: LysM peptidoglycan-binding domain-containing protein [Proteobacteria bacterium]|nr:LysM peptidoglycan-binding domain-containing protein [Pseudomonadota bacterium]
MRFRSLLLALGCAVAVSLPASAEDEVGMPDAMPLEEGTSELQAAPEAEAAIELPEGEPIDTPALEPVAEAEELGELVGEPIETATTPAALSAAAAPSGESELSRDDFDDPGFDPTEAPEELAAEEGGRADEIALPVSDPEAPAPAPALARTVTLGPIGYDDDGRQGRLHTVARGDTLWDISEAYLGTPWVWPSVWIENEGIENPHRISPGELIWITATEMRRVTSQEANELLTATAAGTETIPAATAEIEVPAFDTADDASFEDSEVATVEVPVARDQMPVSVPLRAAGVSDSGRTVRVSNREHMSFISSEALAASSSIVESPEPQIWLAEGDLIYIGLGEGEIEVGDQYTIFRDVEDVRDVGNEALLGYHVKVLGWAEVKEVHPETATAEIRVSVNEIQRGDRLLPRQAPSLDVAVREAPDGLFGRIVFMPDNRSTMGSADYVYLNLGSIHGLEVGTALEVYEPGRVHTDRVRFNTVQTPTHEKAQLLVVSLKPDSSVAFVLHAATELEVGDIVKGADSI